jgi:outer membrane immunogenic protein
MKHYLAAFAAIACVPGVAAAQDTGTTPHFNGARAEARLGWETPTVSESGNVFKIDSALSYGGEVGFDAKLGRKVVAGPYAVYEFSSVKVCDGIDCIREDGNLGLGGRIGVVVSPRVLIYGKLGYARIRFTASSGGATGSDSAEGVQGAIGLNLNFSRHVYGLAEINYADYGRFEGVKLQRRHVAAGFGVRF